MMTLNLVTYFAMEGAGLQALLVGFLILIIVLAIIAGLVWAIENWISPIPPPVKLVIALVLVVLVILWAVKQFA